MRLISSIFRIEIEAEKNPSNPDTRAPDSQVCFEKEEPIIVDPDPQPSPGFGVAPQIPITKEFWTNQFLKRSATRYFVTRSGEPLP